MMSLKEYFKENKKEDIYAYYSWIIPKPKDYKDITREEMYEEVISLLKEEPEIITELGTVEEVNILKGLLDEDLSKEGYGYLEHLLLQNLKSNHLIMEDKDRYYIPKDLINPVKMAINIYDEKQYMYKDITDSVFTGLLRLYNVLLIEEFITRLKEYNILMDKEGLKKYLKKNRRLNKLIKIVKYKKEEYIISLENDCYKEVLAIRTKENLKCLKTLEQVISIGKYKLNLFNEKIFAFLNYLEMHLEPKYIDLVLNEMFVYAGLDINDDGVLMAISDNILELYNHINGIISYLPCWIFWGNSLEELKEISNNKDKKKKRFS